MPSRFLPCAFALSLTVASQQPAAPAKAAPPALDEPAIASAVEATLRERDIPGAVVGVVRGDKLAYAQAFGVRDLDGDLPMSVDTLFQIGSVTKPMTATLLAILASRGVVAFDDTILDRLPDEIVLPAPLRAITLRQLATHMSGLPGNPVNRRDLDGSPSVMLPYSVRELYEALARTELLHPPGSKWSYSNYGYGLLGHLLERAAGKSYADLLDDELLGPLGMTDTSVDTTPTREARLSQHHWPNDRPRVTRPRWRFGEIAGFCGVTSSVRDLARFVAIQYGAIEKAPLDPEALAVLHRPVADGEARPGMKLAMGTGWFIYSLPGMGDVVGHGGEVDGHSSCLAILVERKAGVIVLANVGGNAAETLCQAVLGVVGPGLMR